MNKKFYEVRWTYPSGCVIAEHDLIKETEYFFFTRRQRMRKDGPVFRDREQALRECHRRNVQERQKRLDEIAIIDKLLAETAKEMGELL